MTADELRRLLGRYGLGPRDVLSARSRPYKDLDLGRRDASDEELLALMSEYPALIRRPLIAAADALVVGFDRERLGRLQAG